MNEYKITYTTQQGNAQGVIIERSEAAARKALKAQVKGAEITDIELVDTGVNATKAQEREALEKIKAMVEELGPQSYLKTAFDGAFQDAEDNIDDDAAYSMKARWESSEEKLREMSGNYVAAKRTATVLQEQIEALQEQIKALEAEQIELRNRALPVWLYRDTRTLLTGEVEIARGRMEETAEIMAQFAETPQDIAFKSAVENYRKAKERREICEQLTRGLDDIAPET